MSRTIFFNNKPTIIATSTIAGPKESNGCIARFIEQKLTCDMFNEKTYEKAEAKMLFTVISNCIKNANKTDSEIDSIIAGDLLDQIIASTFASRSFNTGYLGVYNACATFAESLTIGATLIDGKYLNNVICATSSHFSSAERQYRYPLELGCTRPPQSQWTVTGAGACAISSSGVGPKIINATIGKIVDFGVTDANNMGAAMAPSAVDTISAHFSDTGRNADYYDLIVTGDLGEVGMEIASEMLEELGTSITDKYNDCGVMIFDSDKQDTHSGGSGCGCCASVFSGYIYRELLEKRLNRVLLLATGALMSPTSIQQGDAIGGIAHAIAIENLE